MLNLLKQRDQHQWAYYTFDAVFSVT